MKRALSLASILIALTLLSCSPALEKEGEQGSDAIGAYLAGDGLLSDERPAVNILSEKEITEKMYGYCLEKGYFNPNFSIYREQPGLLTAKVEKPIFVYNFTQNGSEYGGVYYFPVVDSQGRLLASFNVIPSVEVPPYEDDLIIMRQFSPGLDDHIITKEEAREIIAYQFPDEPITGPIAVRLQLDEIPYGNLSVLWYFAIGDDSAKSGSGAYREYILDTFIRDYDPLQRDGKRIIFNSKANRTANFFNARMAAIQNPLFLFKQLEDVRRSARALSELPRPGNVSVSPVEMKE